MRADAPLEMWVIYETPRDYPDHWVVRRWLVHFTDGGLIEPDAKPVAVVDTLEQARDAIPKDRCCLGRQMQDDPVIHEVWV